MTERTRRAFEPFDNLEWSVEVNRTRNLYAQMTRAEKTHNPNYLAGMAKLTKDIGLLLDKTGQEILASNPGIVKKILVETFAANKKLKERPHETARSRGISLAEARVLMRAYELDGRKLSHAEIARIEGLIKTADVGRVTIRTRREIAEKISPRNLWRVEVSN